MENKCKECNKILSGKQESFCSGLCRSRSFNKKNSKKTKQYEFTGEYFNVDLYFQSVITI